MVKNINSERTLQPRFTFGGDEHLFVEVNEEMSLDAFFYSILVTNKIRLDVETNKIKGINEICPANASFQLRFNPDIINAKELLQYVKNMCNNVADQPRVLDTRIIEIPVLYNDPWTHETLMRFRERHQDPTSTDIEYAARINNLANIKEFIKAHSETPWFVSMVGFVAGLPFMYQMVEREKQLQVPKYLSPRTDTPKQTLGHGGCFACIYSVRGAGGYQMFGVTPAPIYDPSQSLSYLNDFMIFFKPGDIVKFKPVNRTEYDRILKKVADKSFKLTIKPIHFELNQYKENPNKYTQSLAGGLNG